MGNTTNVAADANPVRVIVTVLVYQTQSFSLEPEEVNPRLSGSEGGWGRVWVRGREVVALSVMHGRVNKQRNDQRQTRTTLRMTKKMDIV
jgi:hypothetical protein